MQYSDLRAEGVLGAPSGEGSVTKVRAGRGPAMAFKAYKAEALGRHGVATEKKLAAMVAHPPSEVVDPAGHQTMLWPSSVVWDGALFVGFCMPLLPAGMLEMEQLIDQQSRSDNGLAEWSWGVMVGIARNMSLAVEALHRNGVRWGDLNQHNMAVNQDGKVSLFDLDTAEVAVGSAVHPGSGFTREEWRPPEYWNVTHPRFTQEGDRWALAVQIHILLMESYRPWVTTPSAQTVQECISERSFPILDAALPVPPGRPSSSLLPPEIAGLLRRTFGAGYDDPGARPTAEEYGDALGRVHAAKFTRCSRVPAHVFAAHCSACPWCERRERARAVRQQSATKITVAAAKPGATATGGPKGAAQPVTSPRPAPAVQPVRQTVPRRGRLSGGGAFGVVLLLALLIVGIAVLPRLASSGAGLATGLPGASLPGGATTSPDSTGSSTQTTGSASTVTAGERLRQIEADDRGQVGSTLAGYWVPQLASATSRPGYGRATRSDRYILARHLRLARDYGSLLLNSSDYRAFKFQGFWVDVAPVAFSSPEGALGWCSGHGFANADCLAKLLTDDVSVTPNVVHPA